RVVGLLVVEDAAPAASDRPPVEVADLADGADSLLDIGLIPVMAVGELDRRADVGADVDLRLGRGAGATAARESRQSDQNQGGSGRPGRKPGAPGPPAGR